MQGYLIKSVQLYCTILVISSPNLVELALKIMRLAIKITATKRNSTCSIQSLFLAGCMIN